MTQTIVPKELLTATLGGLSILVVSGGTDGDVLTLQADGTYAPEAASGGIGGSTGSTDNRVLRADGTGGGTLQSSAVAIDDSGNLTGVVSETINRGTNAGNAAITIGGTGGGTTRINDNGTVVIDSDVTTGTVILACKYNGGSNVFQVGASGTVSVPGFLQLSGGWGGTQAASGSNNFKFSAYRYLSLVAESPDLGGAGGSTYWVEVNNGTVGTTRDFKARNGTFTGPVISGVYTFATVPAASSNSGGAIRISDRSHKWAYSDGTDWRFFGDDAVIS